MFTERVSTCFGGVERLRRENQRQRQLNQQLSEQVAEIPTQQRVQQPTQPDLEAVRDSEALLAKRDRVLADLKLGKQAPGYKAAVKALDRFIKEVQPPS